jgi:hypothetical protein
MLHVLIDCIHVIDAGGWAATAVFCEVSYLSAVKAGSLGASGFVVLLYWGVHHLAVLCLGGVRVGVVALVLSSIVRCSGAREVHRYLYVVVCWARGVGGVVIGPLLGSLLVLGASSPGAWSELALVLSLIVVEPSWVWQPSSSSDEFNHLSALRDVDGPSFVFVVVLWEWYLDDFVEDAWGQSVEEESDSFFVANRVSSLVY